MRKTAFFMKIHPAPFLDFGAAEGGTASCLPPPKAGESLKKQGLARPKAVQHVEKSLTPPKNVKTLKKFFSASGLV